MVSLKTILFPSISNRQAILVIIIVIAFTIPDIMINTVSDFLVPLITSASGISFFVTISIMFTITQYLLLRFVWLKTEDVRSRSFLFNGLQKIVIVSQYTLIAILIAIIFQILIRSQYYTIFLICSTAISLLLTISLIIILARLFFLWYHYYKSDSFIIFIYALAFTIMSLTFIIALTIDLYNLSSAQDIVTKDSQIIFPNYDEASLLMQLLHYVYQYSDLISFVLIWGATALLLLPYRKKLGLVKFWIIISLPLIYYLSTIVDIVGLYEPQTDSENFYYYLYTALNSTAGGIMFGIAFVTAAKKVNSQRIVGYMILAAIGFILLYTSSQVSLAPPTYPPFGIITLMFSGLSSYLLLIGLYSTAVTLSQHSQLRKTIRKSLDGQNFRLIDQIGISEVQKEMDKRIAPLVHRYADQMDTQSALDLSISEEEIKRYVNEVLDEIYKK